jgi:hypothetical protein
VTIANVLDFSSVESQIPPPAFSVPFREIGKDVWARLLSVAATAKRADLDCVIVVESDVGIVLGLLDQFDDLMHRFPELGRDWHLAAFLRFGLKLPSHRDSNQSERKCSSPGFNEDVGER